MRLQIRNNIVSCSFGQTSAYMLRKLMDENAKDFDERFTVIFTNTGKEHDATLDFGHEIETKWGVPIVWLEYCRINNEHAWRIVDYKTAARRFDERTPFDEMLEWAGTLPNVRGRGCSGQLKVRTMKRYLLAQGLEKWNSYIGIRSDESHRILEILAQCPKYITPLFPLNDAGITYSDVDRFWNSHPFRLNIPNHKGNCDLCFLKAKWKRLAIMRTDPSAAIWWINQEKKMSARGVTGNGARWIADVSYEWLLAESQHPELPLDYGEQDIPCSCAVGSYKEMED